MYTSIEHIRETWPKKIHELVINKIKILNGVSRIVDHDKLERLLTLIRYKM